MPEAYRRVVLKPSGLGAEASAQLRTRLEVAIEAQRQLAVDSPHVLQFVGKLREDDRAFTVEHEPARATDLTSLYDPKAPPVDETLLLRVAAALADALRVAHGGEHRDRIVHGGLCAGVVLETPDGVHKIADFGFAPAVCTALDVAAYVELAVAAGDAGRSPVPGTGIWEVLSPDEATRDDRLCGFIDPEKYGRQAFNTFETGSDIIAAGILLHLLAEHRHPMLEDPDAHRMVVLAESMAFWPYNGARRKSLRESSNPAVQCWCDVVARMLARLPKDRPSAGDIAVSFAKVGIKPVDAGEMLRRRLDAITPLLQNRRWDEARQALSAITSAEAVPDDVAERADTLLREVEAHTLLADAQNRLKSDDWTHARDPLDRLTSLSTIPAEVAQQADKLAARLRRNIEVQVELDHAERTVRETATSDPERAVTEARAAIDRATRRLDDKDLVAPVRARCEQVRQHLLAECENLETVIKERETRLARVREWFERLKKAWEQGRLAEVGQLLQTRPDAPHWPDAIRTQTQQIETQYAELQKVPPWIERFREALDAGRLDDAEKVLAQKPKLTHWPATLGKEVKDLEERLRLAKVKTAEHTRAKEWIRRVDGAVGRRDWTAAARELAARPALDHWPAEVVEQERRLRSQVDEQLAEIERQHLETEETNRKTAVWLEAAEQAARRENWAEAIGILQVPPLDTDRLPAEARRTADERTRAYQQAMEEARRKQLERQTQAVRELALTFVRDVIKQELAGLLAAELAEVTVEAVEWDSPDTPTAGLARLTAHVRGLTDRADDEPITSAFEFRLDEKPPRLGDDDGSVRATVRDLLMKRIERLQAGRADEMMTPWRQGLFPQAEWDITLGGPTRRVEAAVHLSGKTEPSSRIETALDWDPRALAWTFADLAALARHALDLVYNAARGIVPAKVLETAGALRPHAAIISVDVDPPSPPVPAVVPASLILRCRLSVRLPGRTDRQPLLDFTAACPKVGQVVIRDSLHPAEQRFEELLVERQNELRSRIEGDLKAYAKAAPAKLKVASLTGRIKRPVNELRFELRPKKGDRVALATPWNPGTFEFELPGSLHGWLANALGDRPAPTERPKRDVPPVQGKDGAKAAPRRGKVPARAFALTAVAAVLGLAVVVPILRSTSGRRTDTLQPSDPGGGRAHDDSNAAQTDRLASADRTTDAAPDTREPPSGDATRPDSMPASTESPGTEPGSGTTTEPDDGAAVPSMGAIEPGPTPGGDVGDREPPLVLRRSPEEALAAVRAIFVASPYLAPHIDTLVTAGEQQNGRLVVTCRLPGLRQPERSLALSLNSEQPSPLSEDDRTAIENDIHALGTLLSDPGPSFERSVRQALRPMFASTPYLNLNRVRARLGSSPDWALDAEGDLWRAVDINVNLVYDRAAPGSEAPPDATGAPAVVEALLAELTTDVAIADGEIVADRRGFADDAADQISKALIRIQADSLAQRRGQLLRNVEKLGAQVEDGARAGSDLRAETTVSVKVRRLLPRPVELQWDRDRLAFVSEGWERTTGQLGQAAAVLGAIDEAVAAEDHWLRTVSLDPTVAPSPTELREPTTDGTWTFGVPSPWPASADAAPTMLPIRVVTTGEAASLERPGYWPLIERYADFASGPVFLDDPERLRTLSRDLNVAVAAAAGAGLTQLADFLTAPEATQRRIVPRFELDPGRETLLSGVDMETVAGGNASEASLTLSGGVRFSVKQTPSQQNDPLASFGPSFLVALDAALADLTVVKQPTVPTGTLRSSVPPGQPGRIVETWSDAQEVASGLLVTLAEVRQLDQMLQTLATREAMEQELEQELNGRDQVPMDANRAYDLLKDIWLVKGQVFQGPQSFAEFSEDRQRQFKRGFSRPKRGVEPTIFIEYFSGPRWTCAVVWSVKRQGPSFPGATVQEGPFLVRVCSTGEFYEGPSGRLSSRLGGVLFDKVLGQIPEAVAADGAGPFGKRVGLVVAYDERMALADVRTLTFTAQRSLLEPADLNTQLDDNEIEWTSLTALRESDWAADYAMTGALSDAPGSFTPIQGARAWALTAIDRATQSAPAPGP